jgi:hypothetical protein
MKAEVEIFRITPASTNTEPVEYRIVIEGIGTQEECELLAGNLSLTKKRKKGNNDKTY